MYESATKAFHATHHRHTTRSLPDVAVLLWFSHWGTYGSPPRWDNWGHVAVWVPGRGILSSPVTNGYVNGKPVSTQEWFSSIAQLEKAINGTYLGYTEDLNGLRVAVISNKSINTPEDEDMPDSMFAVVDGVPSWCWLNWATGKVYSVHTQKEADWIGRYMGSVRFNWSGDPMGSDYYKNKLALFKTLTSK